MLHSTMPRIISSLMFFCFAAVSAAQAPYFQQEVNHQIEVTLDDVLHELDGFIETTYTNNSSDSLDFLWLHVWPNAYEGPHTALAQQFFRDGDLFMFWAMAKDLGGMSALEFRVDGELTSWEFHPTHRDIIRLDLSQALAPGERLTYSTPFRVKLPSGQISRLGHIGQSYQITQWYPKPAVYDRNGWHPMPYLNQGEFYSEFGSFDVRITLPANYTVGATGDWVEGSADNDAEKIRLDSLVRATNRAFELGMASSQSMDFPPSDARWKTLHLRQDNVHDFAWFADKRWMALRGEVRSPAVDTWAFFTPAEANLWQRAPEYLHDAILAYSRFNGDYPYKQVTAVDGTISAGGGMEYPNVTVIGKSGTDLGLETVIVHEVGHNWFYGILGTNERTEAWMDEGINSFNETRYFVEKYGDTLSLTGRSSGPKGLFESIEATRFSYAMRDQFAYLISARSGFDQPMACHSAEFSDLNYGTIVYKKSAAAMEHLRGALGTTTFDAGMQRYFDDWKFKHPTAADLRASLEAVSNQDLGWFFDELVPTTEVVDYRLGRIRSEGADSVRVTVRNVGGIQAPFRLDAVGATGQLLSSSWHEGMAGGIQLTVDAPVGVAKWVLDEEGQMLEYDRRNNTRRAQGLLKGIEPLSLRFLTRLDREDRTPVFWIPTAGWNANDGWMAGLTLHNVTLPFRNFAWHVSALRGLDSKEWVGTSGLSLRTGEWTWEAGFRRFSNEELPFISSIYNRGALSVSGLFNRSPGSRMRSKLRLEAVNLSEERTHSDAFIEVLMPEQWRQALGAHYQVQTNGVRSASVWNLNVRTIRQRDSWGALGPIWENARSTRLASLSFETDYLYNQNKKSLIFGGFLGWVSGDQGLYPLQASGISGQFDPMRDGLFFGRGMADGLTSRQILLNQGGLPLMSGAPVAEEMILTVRAEWELPVNLPLSLYGGLGLADGIGMGASGVAADLGLLKVFVPLVNARGGQFEERPLSGVVWSMNLLEFRPTHVLENGLN